MSRRRTGGLVAAYLAAVVAANLIIASYGAAAVVPVSLVLVAFDLTARDALHEAWRGTRLWPRMAALVAAGSVLSAVLNSGATQVAVASTVAFAAAGLVDAATYALLGRRAVLVRMNGSNVASALVDSVVFPTLAFGALLPAVVAAQFIAKVAGGLAWSLVLRRAVPVRRRP